MSFRNKLNVARSSLNKYDTTMDNHYFCEYCFQRVHWSRSTKHINRCKRRPLNYSSSSSESESLSEDISSDEVEELPEESEEQQQMDIDEESEEVEKSNGEQP